MKKFFKFKNPLKIASLVFFMGAIYNAYSMDIIGLVCFLVATLVFFALSIFRTGKKLQQTRLVNISPHYCNELCEWRCCFVSYRCEAWCFIKVTKSACIHRRSFHYFSVR